MAVELTIPDIGESITEVEIGRWLKDEGDRVEKDEPLVELESDKATVELPAPAAGTLAKISRQTGEKAAVGDVIGTLEPGEAAKPAEPAGPAPEKKPTRKAVEPKRREPAERKQPPTEESEEAPAPGLPSRGEAGSADHPPRPSRGEEELVPMSPIRRRIAERLVAAQHAAALLTTFNEIDMSAVVALRTDYRQAFQERFGVKLGFMSFFVKAAVEALKRFPQLNAEVRGTDIAYRNYYDIGIAVSGGKGLVVPVLRNAETLSFAEIERAVADLAERARDNRIKLEELEGGTFTITNGGVFGSLLSTPIVNPPQSGVLGMHAIQDRPVARDGQVVIRPMMYVALTYDHRIVDGREAVSFLRHVRETIEAPARMLLEL